MKRPTDLARRFLDLADRDIKAFRKLVEWDLKQRTNRDKGGAGRAATRAVQDLRGPKRRA